MEQGYNRINNIKLSKAMNPDLRIMVICIILALSGNCITFGLHKSIQAVSYLHISGFQLLRPGNIELDNKNAIDGVILQTTTSYNIWKVVGSSKVEGSWVCQNT